MNRPILRSIGPVFLIAGLLVSQALAATVNIDGVTVGNPGNAADPATGSLYGAVPYAYKIARTETTIAQYAEFLNAKAKTDPYGLYDTNMGTYLNSAGITRSGTSGNYNYTVIAGSGNHPITWVTWLDAARFVNWLHNGQGSGSTETGAYNLNGASYGIFNAEPGATVWLPTEDEWYKAAYYDPTSGAGGGDNYWLYPMRADTLVNNTVSANYYDGDYATSGSSTYSSTQNYLTDVGAYAGQSSYYGTFDQGGNVFEMTGTSVFLTVGGWSKVQRGGSWGSFGKLGTDMSSSYRGNISSNLTTGTTGFRVASLPEPGSVALLMLGVGAMVIKRRR